MVLAALVALCEAFWVTAVRRSLLEHFRHPSLMLLLVQAIACKKVEVAMLSLVFRMVDDSFLVIRCIRMQLSVPLSQELQGLRLGISDISPDD